MLYMSISGFFANAACGPKAHSDTAPRAFLCNAFFWLPVNWLTADRRGSQRHFRFNPLRILMIRYVQVSHIRFKDLFALWGKYSGVMR